ncbi:hypothetical protein [Pantoea dispersa]|uniref:hypothetical protein n=1 Tax=Pantoea dispersa TaxID=59814 RepID=UPI0021C5E4FD|nr:hypothetical protein [Pantoea dispersa]
MNPNEIIAATDFLVKNLNEADIKVGVDDSIITKDEMVANIIHACLSCDAGNNVLSSNLIASKDNVNSFMFDFTSGGFRQNFNFGIASFKVEVNYDVSSKRGVLKVTSSIFGYNIGASTFEIINGVLMKSEGVDLGLAKIGYEIDVGFLNGLKGKILVFGEINLGGYHKKGSWKLEF